jgi:hypothetical protein
MSIPRRSRAASFVFAVAVAAAATATWTRPELLSTAEPADAVAVAALYPQAANFDAFLAADADQADRWWAQHEASEEAVAALLPRVRELPGKWYLLVVAETWCSDAVNSVPHFVRLAEASPNLELRLLRKEEGASLVNAHPLDGRGRIPLVVVLDENFNKRGVWIERPAALRELVATLKAGPGTEDVGARIRTWYAADAGRSALEEIVALLEQAAAGGNAAAMPDPDAEYTPIQCNMPE